MNSLQGFLSGTFAFTLTRPRGSSEKVGGDFSFWYVSMSQSPNILLSESLLRTQFASRTLYHACANIPIASNSRNCRHGKLLCTGIFSGFSYGFHIIDHNIHLKLLAQLPRDVSIVSDFTANRVPKARFPLDRHPVLLRKRRIWAWRFCACLRVVGAFQLLNQSKEIWDILAVPLTKIGKSLHDRTQDSHEGSIVHRCVLLGLSYNCTDAGSNTDVRDVFKWSDTKKALVYSKHKRHNYKELWISPSDRAVCWL